MRPSIAETPEGFEVSIPVKRRWYICLFLPLWLCGWVAGEITASRWLLAGNYGAKEFLVFFLAVWTAGGILAIYSLLWQIGGKEVITFSPAFLIRKRMLFGFPISRKFKMSRIRDLRFSPPKSKGLFEFDPLSSFRLWGIDSSAGSITFDYGAKTHRFGDWLNEAEADFLIRLTKEKFGMLGKEKPA